jgi:Predicted periplasmic ligand-binding sensor domain
MRTIARKILPCVLLSVFFTSSAFAIGQSAVITLVFPPGARATGLGEAFVGLADDANATFFNPAGLGQAPLANSWKAYKIGNDEKFFAIASKKKKEFSLKEKIWVGTGKGVSEFDGNAWTSYEKYLIQPDDNLTHIAKKYLPVDNEEIIRKAVKALRKANGIEEKRTMALEAYFRKEISDSLLKQKNFTIEQLADSILDLSNSDRNATKIYVVLTGKIDSVKANVMSDEIEKIVKMKDVTFDNLVELKVPFSIAIDDSVTALAVDSSEKVWIGTPHGLWRYDGTVWNIFTITDGLPSNNITAISIGSEGNVAAGTDMGLGLYAEGKWSAVNNPLASAPQLITAIAFGRPGEIYMGTFHGLVIKKDTSWTTLDSSNGLLSNHITALLFDSQNKLWIGGPNGITIYDEKSWKRYKFPESVVSSIAENNAGTIWIGTNKGAISYKAGKTKVDKSGKNLESPPEWKTFHSKNALVGDNVHGIAIHGNDVWIATTEAINQYAFAEKQVLTFYEQLLPAFKIPDLWHIYMTLVWPTEDWGTLGFTINYINFGINEWTDELGKVIGRARSWEGVFGLSYGISLMQDFSLGLNIKYAYSALAPGYGPGNEGVGQTFAIDAALLKRNFLVKDLDLGFNLQNMGPSIFYISQQEQDPIPFTIKLGTAYHLVQTPIHSVTFLLDLNREVVKNYMDKPPDPFYTAIYTDLIHDTTQLQDTTTTRFMSELEEVNLNAGIEYWYANFLALRIGHLFDYIGKRFELTLGLGLKYGNINFDWSFIHSPEGFMKGIVQEGSNGSRNGQWRASLLMKF